MEQVVKKRKSASEIRDELSAMKVEQKLYIDNPSDAGKYRLEANKCQSYMGRIYRVLQDEKKMLFVYRAA